jgi:hypothetical protein
MFDGIVKTLCNVRRILDLRKNLISLGILDHKKFSFKFEGEVLKVSKSVMTVMKGNRLLGSIYKLLGTIVVGGAKVVQSELNNTVLWHMRLGHIGEREMMKLHKKSLLKGFKTCELDFSRYYVIRK